ncbi:MAG: response regulator [Candidatus Parabeggiatoa sp. nov. 2]|nr:MAG: hypothetical protein B6247_16355 [Beggiatoa sp. 4572_84]RKZ59393.1 MAG: response regulator [Gammaproteobacteria bacterium]
MKESLTRATLFKVGLWITIVIILTTIICYLLVASKIEKQTLEQLEKYVIERGQRENNIFALAQDNHALIKAALVEQLESQREPGERGAFQRKSLNGSEEEMNSLESISPNPVARFPNQEISAFDYLFARDADGVIRNRPEHFDGSKHSCVYINKSLPITTDLKRRVLTFYELTSQYGPAWSSRFSNTYIFTADNIIAQYWPNIPSWCQDATADLDLTQQESFWVADSQHNPDRTTVWTGVYYDAVASEWLVSAITPVEIQGQHIANIGNDIELNDLLERALTQRLQKTYNIIFRSDGRLIVHPRWIYQMMDKGGKFNMLKDGSKQLKRIFHLVQKTGVGIVEDEENYQYLAITKIAATDWYFVVVFPKTFIAKTAWETAQLILILGFVSLLIVLIILYIIMHQQLTKPLNDLLIATQRLGEHNFDFQLDFRRNDELGRLAESFKAMAMILGERERQLIDYANDLEENNVELIHAKEKAETANVTKSQFIANMSHELRTPLNAIIGYSEMLQEDAIDMGEEDFVADLDKIQTAGKHLLGLINDVLDISKIEAGKMEIYTEPFDLLSLLDEVVTTVQPLMKKQNNTLRIQGAENLDEMYADLTKVRQALLNLLSNAAKFTKNGVITLVVKPCENEAVSGKCDWIELSVSDTGIGMNEAQIQNLFQAFTQADPTTTRKYGGTGLGLVITKRFTEMMGGTISVESELGQGSTFRIRLPAKVVTNTTSTPEAAKTDTTSNERQSQEQSRVLVIDDDPSVRDLFKNYLIKQGYQVAVASGGDEGLRLARQLHPNAITLDVMMPGMDGWMVLSALKTDPALTDIPVIMASMIEDKQLGYSLGAADYLIKPIDSEQLAAVLNKYHINNQAFHHLMIIEDEPTTRQMIETMLEKAGWYVVTAENGRIGLEKVGKKQPDLILLDLMMPEMDGFEFLVHLREHENWRNIPVVVLTAKEITNKERETLNNYVQTVFQKGHYHKDKLLKEIRDLLDNQ